MISESKSENERSKFIYKEAILELGKPTKAKLSVLQPCFKQLDSSRIRFNLLVNPTIMGIEKDSLINVNTITSIKNFVLEENQTIYEIISNAISSSFENLVVSD